MTFKTVIYFLGTSGERDSESGGTAEMPAGQTASIDENAAFMEEDLLENNDGQKTVQDGMFPGSKAVSRPITFIKGDLLNREAAVQALAGTPAEAALQALEETEVQGIPSVSSYLTGGDAAATGNAFPEDHAGSGTDTEDIWAEAGTENMDGSEADSLMKQAALEHAVTSVGYEDILDGVSLQYVAAGSTLKEYILVSEPQDAYEYLFLLKLDNLIPASQSDGSIFLLDKESGETVYEIPAAYMTDAAGGYSDAVDVEIAKKAEGEYLLQISASKEWINDEERVFPVKIDPTLNKKLTSSANVRGNYVEQGHPGASSTNYGEMYVGYDSSGNKNMITYIQLKNLPALPADSVVCSSVFNMAVLFFSEVNWPRLTIRAKEVKNTSWDSAYTWSSRPSSESLVIDHKTITSSDLYKYVGWDITSLVKAHYDAGNETDEILAFSLEAYGTMSNLKCANTALNLLWDGAEPLFQVFYRDTRGVEDYYTYQTQSIGRAGTGYISDYNSQLTVVKPLSAYESTIMPYDIGLAYTSANSGSYFTNGGDIHTADFTKMHTGTGWKLTIQETVVPVSVTDVDGTATYLVYNDADGTEHYFHKSESDSTKYEDEDGLGLTIKKSSTKYELTDKKDNKKTFTSAGYLTKIEDANGNAVNIVYDAGRAVRVESVPKGETGRDIFTLGYSGNILSGITDYAGRTFRFLYSTDKNGKSQLAAVLRDGSQSGTGEYEAEYSYDAVNLRLTHAYDSESNTGMYYTYQKGTTGYRVYEYHEYASPGILGTQTRGAGARTWSWEMRRARYRFSGADGMLDTADDVINTYLFNSAGQTINARSENEATGTLLGASASAYTKNSGTSAANNRMNSGITTGQSGISLLLNGGFEKEGDTGTSALSWQIYAADGSAARRAGETADTRKALSGKSHYNLWGNSTSSVASIYQDITVEEAGTYTFSAYVNTTGLTAAAADGGVYLYARRTDTQAVLGESVKLGYATDAAVEGGWQRLTAVFEVPAGVTARFTICSYHAAGLVMADDVQMEKSSAASRFNHVYNGSFETADSRFGWDGTGSGTLTATREEAKHGAIAYKMSDPVPEATLYIGQTIQLYRNSGTTFLLSGWGKGNSVPGFAEEIEGKNDSTLRYWGITLTLNYADGTASEHFHLPFCDYATDWQYAAMSVVPKAQDKLITTAQLKLYYKNNANTAYFDSISLIEEPAQTYKYDKDGNLTSVKSSGNGEDAYTFKEGTMDLTKVATEGSGDYTYEYKNTANKHLPTSIINDTVTMNVTYDAKGQTTGTALLNNKNATALSMTSLAAYSDGLLGSVTDNTGAVTSYSYDARRRATGVTDACGTSTGTVYENVWDRASGSYIYNVVSVANAYADGNLAAISRTGYLPGAEPVDANKKVQTYHYTHDAFGNVTGIDIGSLDYADYTYRANNGNLARIEYAWGATPQMVVDYSYDELDRVREVQYYDNETSESRRYGYQYGSDGNLSGITENGELAYTYEYDSLGRLIHSSMLEDGSITLYTDHTYDTSDRILTQSWQIGEDGFSESVIQHFITNYFSTFHSK